MYPIQVEEAEHWMQRWEEVRDIDLWSLMFGLCSLFGLHYLCACQWSIVKKEWSFNCDVFFFVYSVVFPNESIIIFDVFQIMRDIGDKASPRRVRRHSTRSNRGDWEYGIQRITVVCYRSDPCVSDFLLFQLYLGLFRPVVFHIVTEFIKNSWIN